MNLLLCSSNEQIYLMAFFFFLILLSDVTWHNKAFLPPKCEQAMGFCDSPSYVPLQWRLMPSSQGIYLDCYHQAASLNSYIHTH